MNYYCTCTYCTTLHKVPKRVHEKLRSSGLMGLDRTGGPHILQASCPLNRETRQRAFDRFQVGDLVRYQNDIGVVVGPTEKPRLGIYKFNYMLFVKFRSQLGTTQTAVMGPDALEKITDSDTSPEIEDFRTELYIQCLAGQTLDHYMPCNAH